MSDFYIYFNDQKQITSVSGRKNEELTDRFGTFPREEVIDFMNGNKSFVNYQIVENRKTGKIRIEEKKTNEVVVQTLDDKLYKIQPLTNDHYDVKIIIENNIMHIALHENIRKDLLGDASDITINGATTLQFFITKKDDPHFLKKEIIIDIINLIKQDITVDCTPLGEFSIYTKRVYEDYTYEDRR
tara:strand:+ start:34 stop:591 length:558 start_codon:yes stop_codon:yes gene_type:complete